jgi:hydroxyacylglutathione hydrolase
MCTKIYSLKLGINRCYFIKEKGCIMIDSGPPKSINTLKKFLGENQIVPEEIKLVILTHSDFDHCGSANEVRNLTGAKICIHKNDRIKLEQALFSFPSGTTMWGSISHALLAPVLKNIIHLTPVKADIILDDNDFSLKEFGIKGKIIFTPGHTSGSVSVLLETGDAFIGCLAHNNFPFRLSPGLPIYAEDIEKVRESWKRILEWGVKMIYPGHGDPFPVDVIKNKL